MKTVLEEFLEEIRGHGFYPGESKLKEILDKEKKQITDAFIHGNRLEFYDATEEEACKNYYDQTFEKK